MGMEEGEMGMGMEEAHVRHCVDLLRQSLMCNADMTFEVRDEDAGGMHGFGVRHVCRDWGGLNELMEGWQGERG